MKSVSYFLLSLIYGVLAVPAFSQMVVSPPQIAVIPQVPRAPDPLVVSARRMGRTKGLDSASRKELDSMRRVNDEDRAQYEGFLKADNTGILKLFHDNGCVQRQLIRVDGECSGFVPDSSIYTFRTGYYQRGSGDIGYFKNAFISPGFFSQSIMVSLGNIAIEEVTEAHPAIKRLAEFTPPEASAAAEKFSRLIANGVYIDRYRYARRVNASAGPTYAVRKIEFNKKGKDVRYRVPTAAGLSNFELSLDSFLRYKERKDTIYVFRVVRKGEDGAVTIVWKQLSRKNAPAIVFGKGDKLPDFAAFKPVASDN